MNAKVEKLENNQVKLEITIDAEKFEDGLKKAFFRNAKHFNVPGFRKGKAPMNIVEKYYGASVLYEEAFNIVVPEVYEEVLRENEIEAVATPDIDISQIEKGKDLIFTATVTVKPEVKLGKYKEIKLEKKNYKVTKEDVANEIKQMAEKNARVMKVEDRPLQNGDVSIIDFEGFMDGAPFDGGKAESHELEIGSGSFIPGFEEQLVGMQIGEEKEIKVTFPEEYFSKDLAGKEATFKVKLNEIKAKELPEIDDEFAKDVSEFDTLKELETSVKERLEEENEKKAKFELEEDAIAKVSEATEIDIPQVMIDLEVENYLKDFETRLSYQGLSLNAYLQLLGKDISDVKEEYVERAKKNIKTKLVLEAIFKEEKIEITEEDINRKLTEIAKEYGRDAQEFVKNANEQVKDFVKEELRYDLGLKFIINHAKNNEKETAKGSTKNSEKADKK